MMMAIRCSTSRTTSGLVRLAMLMLIVLGAAAPGTALAATSTVTCSDVTLPVLDDRSVMDTSHIDMNAGSCKTVASGTPSSYDSGFSLQGYTAGAANSGAILFILPSAIIGGLGQRFNSDNPVQCTGPGCGNWTRGDYALCAPSSGACHFTASFQVNGFPASISGDVPSGRYSLTNITVSYEPASLPPPPKKAPVFSGVPSNISVNTDAGQATAVVSFTPPTATDDVDGPVTPVLTAGLAPGSAFPVGVTMVTYTATDEAENADTASFTVTVTDAEKPVIGKITDIVTTTDMGKLTAAVTLSATVSDNVDAGSHFTPVFKIGNSVISSGYAFPVGTTSVTVDANNDTAGNAPEQISFKVTVGDEEAPSFSGFPENIEITVEYPEISAVATWTEPKASDNDPDVTVTRTAGPASGSSFPLGTTTVTYEAEDSAGNVVPRSFTVTVTQRTPGTVSFVVKSAADRSFGFTSRESVLNVSVTTSGGSGNSGPIVIRPGTYAFGFNGPADTGIESASCTSGGTIDSGARSGTIELVSGASVTCTITALNSVQDTRALIVSMATIRAQAIIAMASTVERRLDRLNGRISGGDLSAFGMSYASESFPLSVTMGQNEASFAFSLQDAQSDGSAADVLTGGGLAADPDAPSAADPSNSFDLWLEGKYAKFDTAGGDGAFAVLHTGIDYIVHEDLLFGIGAQLDWTSMEATGGAGSAEGLGFMIGPYLTAKLAPGVYFDGHAAWGYSYNSFSPYGTYTNHALGERALVTAALGGEIKFGGLEIRPETRLSWYREQIAGYTDSLNVAIPGVVVETGTLSFGPTFRLPTDLGNGVIVTPFAGIDGIWTFAQSDPTAGTDLRASVEAGLDIATEGGLSVSASGFYDGLGTTDYQVYGGTLTVGQSF